MVDFVVGYKIGKSWWFRDSSSLCKVLPLRFEISPQLSVDFIKNWKTTKRLNVLFGIVAS